MTKSKGKAVTPEVILSIVGRGGLWTRKQIAEQMQRPCSTNVVHAIEICTALGWIVKQQGVTSDHRMCWVYSLPQVAPRFGGM